MADAAKGAARAPWGWLFFGFAALVLIGVAYHMFAVEVASGTAESSTIVANAGAAINQAVYSTRQILGLIGGVLLAVLALAFLAMGLRGGGGGHH